jgi:hypothetical protein
LLAIYLFQLLVRFLDLSPWVIAIGLRQLHRGAEGEAGGAEEVSSNGKGHSKVD